MSFVDRFAGISKVLTIFVVLALLAAVALVLGNNDGKRYVTIDFPQTNSVYEGSDVKILGVAVGRVEKLTPRGDTVRAKVSYDGEHQLPADVRAVVVSPSIVGDRYIQLAPAYDGGAVLEDNATLSVDRTAVPVELDQVYKSLDDLAVALGPEGANEDGSLSSLVDDAAGQLDGQGAQLNETIQNFGKLSTTLSNNKDDLFGGIREVEQFVSLLKTNDAAVRSFNDSTAEVSEVLEGEREDLQATLEALGLALGEVNTLVSENRGALRDNVDNIASLAGVLASRKDEIEQIVINAPTALSNVALTYNANFGTLDTRADLPETLFSALDNPSLLLCNLLGETIDGGGLCETLNGILDPLLGAGEDAAADPEADPDAAADPLAGLDPLADLDQLERAAAASETAPTVTSAPSTGADALENLLVVK